MMDLLNYWPPQEYINQCIRTEAEELPDYTLLAVHEPMRLLRRGESETKICSDEDLLKEFLQVERPIPIIGRAGVGKSHLIRWLHSKLKGHAEAAEWHIVRIPKNASLRQVLELLLAGLEGETFEQARQRVKSVGEQLDTREVAELLLTFMGQQLRKTYGKALDTIEQYRKNGTRPQPEEVEELRAMDLHCGDRGLPALINDPHFQTYLLKKEHCIFQFARRLTRGANDDELSDNDYQIHARDLDFNYNLGDLSIPARQYVQQAQLNTSDDKRQEAVDMLNSVLGEATRTAFQQLFQFSGSNFQELFKQIRRDLYDKGQTLVVLVEDMALISAIEDVLIDSLLEEGVYEGVMTMCSVRSAIAVTDGYSGYLRRRASLRTRAGAEWWIEEFQEGDSEQAMLQKVVDFCSRYINAARYGNLSLKQCWDKRGESQWPPIWLDEEVDRQYLDAFGRSRTGISLYPLNALAISALANKYCRDDKGQLRFNPRQVIREILWKVLKDCRGDAERGQFPPASLAGIFAPGTLRSDLAILGLKAHSRCESLSAIWGYGAKNLSELKEKLSADIALSFGLIDLSNHLQGGVMEVKPVTEPEGDKVEGGSETHLPPRQPPPPDPGEQKLKELLEEVDLWCHRQKELAQNEAKTLRKALAAMYENYAHKEWVGIAKLPSIKSGNRVNITLHWAAGNIAGWVVEFCSKSDFTDQDKSILFHDAARAMLRYSHFNPENREGKGWNYPQGHEDFLRYQNFASRWVPGVLQTLRDNERINLDASMTAHVTAARALAVFKEDDNHRERLNKLLQSQQTIAEAFPPPVCDAVSTERQIQLAQWEALQEKWRNLLASNEHGLEGDLALAALKKALKIPLSNKINQAVTRALRELEQGDANMCVSLFADCKSVDDFDKTIQDLDALVKQLRTAGKYPTNGTIITSRALLSKIKGLTETGHFEQVRKMKRISENNEVSHQWQMLNELDGDKVRLISNTLGSCKAVFDIVLPSLQNENSVWGAERVTEGKEIIDSLLVSLYEMLKCVQGDSDGNA